MLSGTYAIPNIHEDVYGMFTNTTPVDAYRGAGRPEATFLVERLVDLLAAELKMDPAEVRRKNFIPPFTDGHTVATGLVYDTGNYVAALDKALEMADYKGLRKKQADLRAKGEYTGIGLCTYAEICGLGPSQVAGAVGFGGGLWESAIVRFHPSGKVHVFVGVSPHGQGEETTFAQIMASELGVGVDDVTIFHGDTSQTPMGWGTYGSRTTAVGSGALMGAIVKIKDKAKIVTAHLLEAAVEDIDYADGKFFVKGSPSKFKTIQDVALMANVAWNYPKGLEPGLEASAFFDPPELRLSVRRPHRGGAGGRGDGRDQARALRRGRRLRQSHQPHDRRGPDPRRHRAGQSARRSGKGPSTTTTASSSPASMMDYAIPKADAFPAFELGMTETPTTVNPLGVKGIGETGTIASTPAVYNAVMDALAPLGVKRIDMPLTPERVWRAIREAKRS